MVRGEKVMASTLKPTGSNRFKVVLIIAMLAAVGGGSLLAFRWVAASSPKHLAPTAILSASQKPVALTLASAKSALLAFHPANDTETVGQALRTATGQVGTRTFPGRITVTQTAAGKFDLVVTVPVNVKYLLRHGEIHLGNVPGSSSLEQGKILVAGNTTVYSLSMDPKTRVARFHFALNPDDTMLWAYDWNANGIVSQNDSLN